MSEFLADTNIISELMRREPNSGVTEWANRQEQLVLSVVSVEEIITGLRWKSLPRKEDWFRRVIALRGRVLEVDSEIAERSGSLRGTLLQQGRPRSIADTLIAATAWKYDLTIVTRNTRDFEGFQVPVWDPFAS